MTAGAKSLHRLWPMIAIGFAMFSDGFLYGVLIPLTSHSIAAINDEGGEGLLYMGYAVGVVLFTPFIGFIADRVGKKGPLLSGCIIQMLAILVFAFASDFWTLFFARVLQGGAAGITWTAGLAIIAQHYKEDRVEKMGLSMVGYTAGYLVGPIVGGTLFDLRGYALPLALVGLVAVIDFTLRVILVPKDRPSVPSHALLLLVRNRSVLVCSGVVALIAGGWGVVEPYFPPHLEEVFSVNPSIVGILFTATGVAYALVTVPVQRMAERRGLRDTIALGLLLMALSMPLMVFVPNLILACILVCLVSVAYAFSMNPILAELGEAVDRVAPGAYASVYVIFNIAYSIGMIGGDLITHPVIEHYNLLAGYALIALLLLASLPLLYWSFKSPRKAPHA